MPNPDQDRGINTDRDLSGQFDSSTENQKWSIRFGAEPIDLHLSGKGSALDKWFENTAGITASGWIFNTNYIEVVNPDGEVAKRVHAVGLNEDWEMKGGGRLVGFVVDGKYTTFADDLLQQDDPHSKKPNQLQNADTEGYNGVGYTQIAFEGTEREVLQLYGGLVKVTIEINNQGPEFGLFGQTAPNSNSFNSEMKEKLDEIGAHLGIKMKEHNAPNWDIGADYEMQTQTGTLLTCESLPDLRERVDQLEQLAAEQLKTLKGDINADLEMKIDGACILK